GTTNLIAGIVEDVDASTRRVTVATALGRITGIDPGSVLAEGAKVRVSIRPEDLSPQAPPDDAAMPVNVFAGRLTFAVFAGTAVEAELRCGDTSLQCLLNREVDLTLGRALTGYAKPD